MKYKGILGNTFYLLHVIEKFDIGHACAFSLSYFLTQKLMEQPRNRSSLCIRLNLTTL